ncbi:DUF4252 domain-containing protein [Chryseobacterium oryctis]|uniref:DUF4252 domain-containing protein n=1 Tax=Chryseobacterium oryctis TaxID=2952618 RepID=A0ABT3HKN0_9FLAO|nr:DUF4252 domain-containing protein [Chryseobacterium oryctis]MCW3160353.1 DUF4252 domain-containing protein [Chryseobacterium oryctis]
MKNIFCILILVLNSFVPFSAQTEKLNQLFQDFEKNGGVTSINIKKPMFKLLNNIDVNDDYINKIKPILGQVDGLKLLIIPKATFPENLKSENAANIKMNEEKAQKINKALSKLNLEELMSMNNEGTSMKFLAETGKGDFLENLILNIDSDEENILFLLNGKMKLDDVNKIINSSEIKSTTATNAKNNTASPDNNASYLNGEIRNVGEFSGVQVSTGVNVVFKQESPTNVKVIADADKLQYVVTKVENGVLKVFIDNKGVKNLKFKNLSVNVSSPRIENIKASSGANFAAVNRVKENNLTIDASSGSAIKGNFNVSNATSVEVSSGSNVKADINTKNIIVKASSGAGATLAGSAHSGIIDVSSGSSCKAEDLKINNVEVEATSGAGISINALNRLKVRASSGGSVKYRGNPEIEANISKTSGGSLKPIN